MNDSEHRCSSSERVLDEREHMVLTGAEREALLEAMLQPPKPTATLVTALRRHRDLPR